MVAERFQLWRERITNSGQYKPEPELTVNSRICSKHFVKQDYLDNCQNKPVTGNHILSKEAVPSRFRWSSSYSDISAAVPFVRRIKPTLNLHSNHPHSHYHHQNHNFHEQQNYPKNINTFPKSCNKDNTCIEHSAVEKQTQCSFEDDRLKNEVSRKNSIIQQLLERISQLEAEHKATTQILLKETISVGTPTSVIRSTSPRNPNLIESKEKESNSNNNMTITLQNNSNTNNISRKRKLQNDHHEDQDEDENIHYVLLSLSEKVVRHDDGPRST